MNRTIVNPNKVNHKMYIGLVVIFLITLFISLIIPEEKSSFCKNVCEIIKNLSYGCVASTVVAWLIDCTNIKNQNKKANSIYDAVYMDLKVHIADYIGIWAQCTAVVFKEKDYYSEKNSWIQWYKIFKGEYFKLEEERQAEVLDFLLRQLSESVQRVRNTMDRIQSQRYILTINDVMNSEMERILEDFRFEFYALDLGLERNEKSEQFWGHMDAITDDLTNYIGAWADIKFYNTLQFRPYKFWDKSDELYKAMVSSVEK